MSKNSITAKISLFFAIFVVLIFAIAGEAVHIHHRHIEHKFFEHVISNLDNLPPQKPNEDIYLSDIEASLLSAAKTDEILKTKKEIPRRPLPPPIVFENKPLGPPPREFENIKFYGDLFSSYLVAEINGKKVAFQDKSFDTTFYFYFTFVLSSILIAVTLLYIAILKSLKPLKDLEKDIEAFGFGVKPQISATYQHNEIGRIQKSFHAASNKIAGLLDAREIFLKNAAHELKTPIAKGIIVAHMVSGEKQQKRLLEIFSSMTQIIEGIMTAEELMAKGFSPKIEPVLLRSFCEKIRKKLLLESTDILISIEPTTIVMSDPKLLEIAIANLFENAVKFNEDKGVAKCFFENGRIFVENNGTRLEEPIDKYFEPFFKETSIRNENGMGLGLYLTKKVLEIQGLRLIYEYNNGTNRFIIG